MAELLFDGQRDNEKVVLVFRRHILTARRGVLWLIILMGLGALPMLMYPDNPTMFWIFLGATTLGFLGMLYALLLWHFSLFIVTDQRIRQVVQKGMFKKAIVDLSLDKIDSISMSVNGIFASLFNYGTLIIQTTVGEQLKISQVKDVKTVYNKLQNL